MRDIQKLSFFIFIAALFIMTVIDHHHVSAEQSNSSVLFDYSNYPQSKEFSTDLDGEWYFFEKQLLTPDEVADQLINHKERIVSIPSSFKVQTGEVNSFGTYSTRVKIPKEYIGETLAIHIPYQYSAYTLYVDQIKIASNGVVGQDAASHIAEMAPKTGHFIAQSDEIMLTMQVSSFEHIRGGFEKSIYLGESSIIVEKYNTTMIGTLFINGSIFIIGLFTFLFALHRRQEHIFLIFGIFCMLIAVRALFAVPFYYTMTSLHISWIWGTRLEYILTEATSMFFVILLWKWHEKEFSKKIMYGLVIIHLGLIITTLFTQPVFFQSLFFNVFYLAIPFFFYMIYVISKSIRNKNRSAKVNLIGMALIFLAFFNDFAIGQNLYQGTPLMLPAVGVYVLIHVVLMSRNYAEAAQRTEDLNRELIALNATLDEKIQDRTLKLEQANKRLEQLASIDSLTGLYNRRSFNEYMEETFRKAIEQDKPLSLLMLDLDEFKKYNDYYGHVRGDHLLTVIPEIIDRQLPENSFLARYGGEEFVVVFPGMSKDKAYEIAEKVRKSVEKALIAHPKRESGIVTFSIGVATMTKETSYESVAKLIDAADKRLYQAKRAGGNCVR